MYCVTNRPTKCPRCKHANNMKLTFCHVCNLDF